MMKIKSITDIITNSSSEVFVIRKDDSTKDCLQKIKEFHESHKMIWSLFEEKYEPIGRYTSEMYEKIRQDGLDYFSSGSGGPIEIMEETDKTLEIEIDENYLATHDFIEKNYEVLGRYNI